MHFTNSDFICVEKVELLQFDNCDFLSPTTANTHHNPTLGKKVHFRNPDFMCVEKVELQQFDKYGLDEIFFCTFVAIVAISHFGGLFGMQQRIKQSVFPPPHASHLFPFLVIHGPDQR